MDDILLNTDVLSNFTYSDSLSILKKLYNRSAFVTDFIMADIVRGIQSGYKNLEAVLQAIQEGWIQDVSLIMEKEKALFHSLSVSLSLGEASGLAVAEARGFVFACDDKAAREESCRRNIPVIGTKDILDAAVKSNNITARESATIISGLEK